MARLEQDRGVVVVVESLEVASSQEGNEAQAERRETFGLAARLLGGFTALGLRGLQALAATLGLSLYDLDPIDSH